MQSVGESSTQKKIIRATGEEDVRWLIEFILEELSGQVLVIKCHDSREGENHRLLINRTSHLKSDWGVRHRSNEDSHKLQQKMRKAATTVAGG